MILRFSVGWSNQAKVNIEILKFREFYKRTAEIC